MSYIALAALVLLGCFSPSRLEENVCRRCTSSCPSGLVCSGGRCLSPCDLGCAVGTRCTGAVCVPTSGDPVCPEAAVTWNLCVGRAVDAPLSQTLGQVGKGWVVLESQLPEGLTLDAELMEVRGAPRKAGGGSLWLREGGPGAPELTVQVNAGEHCAGIAAEPLEWCVGEPRSTVLHTTDGRGGYAWRASNLPAGLRLIGAELSGQLDEPASYSLPLTLLDGPLVRDSARLELAVVACDEPLSAPPAAPDDAGTSRATEGLEPPAPPLGGDAPSATSGTGTSARSPLRITTPALPDACIGEVYQARLEASGGGGSYVWRAFGQLPAGLTLDVDGVVHGTVPAGTPSGAVRLTVGLASALEDPPISGTVSLTLGACNSLAFIAGDGAVDRLFVAAYPVLDPRDASRGLLAEGERVRSFRFSPTGTRLAFLVDSPGSLGPARVYLENGAEGPARLVEWPPGLAAEVSVVEYLWSPSGAHLALLARAGSLTLLATIAGGSSQISAVVDVTPRYLGDLFWATELLCYKAPGELSRQRNVLCHQIAGGDVTDAAFASGLFLASELEGATLLGGPEGYLAILPDGLQAYYRDLQSGLSFKHVEHVFSPSLRWAAGIAPGATDWQLSTSAPERATQDTRILSELAGCDAPHAWSADDSTLACKSGDELLLIELGAEGRVRRSVVVAGSAGYPAAAFRRLFAPDGRWYAYDAGEELRVVDTGRELPVSQVVGNHGGQSPYVGLGTDVFGRSLVYHHGSRLEVLHPAESLSRVDLSGGVELSEPPPCSSSYLSEGPLGWCGASRLPGSFFPEREGRLIAYLDTASRLYVAAPGSGDTRQVLDLPVNCKDDANELRCDQRVQWAAR